EAGADAGGEGVGEAVGDADGGPADAQPAASSPAAATAASRMVSFIFSPGKEWRPAAPPLPASACRSGPWTGRILRPARRRSLLGRAALAIVRADPRRAGTQAALPPVPPGRRAGPLDTTRGPRIALTVWSVKPRLPPPPLTRPRSP